MCRLARRGGRHPQGDRIASVDARDHGLDGTKRVLQVSRGEARLSRSPA